MTTLPTAFRLLLGRTDSELSVPAGYMDLGHVNRARAARSMAKRSMDVVGALGGLIFLSPLMLIVALLIRLDSRGPSLFRQQRRPGGADLLVPEARTMVLDAETVKSPGGSQRGFLRGILQVRDDPRVTPLGRLLRRTSIDELPQLWNVLVGDMSLMGTAPCRSGTARSWRPSNAEDGARLSVLPGLSGPWQVAGRSNLDSVQDAEAGPRLRDKLVNRARHRDPDQDGRGDIACRGAR